LHLVDEGDLVLLQEMLRLNHAHARVLDDDREGD